MGPLSDFPELEASGSRKFSAVFSRYNGFSVVYLAFLLLSSLLCSPSASSMRVHRIYLILFNCRVRAIDGLTILFSQVDATDIVCLMAPYIWMAPVGLVTSRLGHELAEFPGTTAPSPFDTMGHAEDETRGEGDSVKDHESDFEDDIPSSSSEVTVLEPFPPAAWKVLVTLLLGAARMVSPSVTSAVYSGAFLGLGSWWACRRALSTVTFSTLCVLTAIFTVGHLGGLYLYQLPFFQDLVPPDDIYTRLLAMTALIKTNHTDFWKFHLHPSLDWPEIANPLILLLSYYTLVLLLPQWSPQPGKREGREVLPTRSPSKGKAQELRSVLCTSGSEEEQTEPRVPSPGNKPRPFITLSLLSETRRAGGLCLLKLLHTVHFTERFLHRAVCPAWALREEKGERGFHKHRLLSPASAPRGGRVTAPGLTPGGRGIVEATETTRLGFCPPEPTPEAGR
ncbi:hypothetical protein J1605_012932 [Eschrichtius robustus]|uniref:Piezo TM1-24 domain-containing protein n=1 Tax=Eschrichtius robustus TaxID=9764 RepID=A0AB34GG41_ESCRO|nr:hypothetical protein J1605_012932 [Eschrichtius robustus]